jgi:hypothetical protein
LGGTALTLSIKLQSSGRSSGMNTHHSHRDAHHGDRAVVRSVLRAIVVENRPHDSGPRHSRPMIILYFAPLGLLLLIANYLLLEGLKKENFCVVISSVLLAVVVEKSKKCLDHTATLFLFHFIFTCAYEVSTV